MEVELWPIDRPVIRSTFRKRRRYLRRNNPGCLGASRAPLRRIFLWVGKERKSMRTAILVATDRPYGSLLFSGQSPAIRRLDGSGITPNQIDQTVVRLMSAAKVAGVGISTLQGSGRVLNGVRLP